MMIFLDFLLASYIPDLALTMLSVQKCQSYRFKLKKKIPAISSQRTGKEHPGKTENLQTIIALSQPNTTEILWPNPTHATKDQVGRLYSYPQGAVRECPNRVASEKAQWGFGDFTTIHSVSRGHVGSSNEALSPRPGGSSGSFTGSQNSQPLSSNNKESPHWL